MQIENGKIETDVQITGSLSLRGQACGNVEVLRGGELWLDGMCVKNLTVNSGGSAIIRGMVCGNVLNNGGEIQVFGTIIGSLHTIGGHSHVDPRAVIQNRATV